MDHNAAYPDRVIEWMFAVMMASWGCYLLLPMATFDNPQYAVLASIAPEQVWGVFSIAIATVRMVALWVNGRWRRTPAVRCACSTLGVIWWCAMVFLIIGAPQPHPAAGLVWYPVFALFEIISCWRSAADGFHSGAFRFHGAMRVGLR